MNKKTILFIIIGVIIIIAGGLYWKFSSLMSDISENLKKEPMKEEFINFDKGSINEDDIAVNDSVIEKRLPKDSIKLAVKDGETVKLKDGSLVGVKDSVIVAVKDGTVKELKDTASVELADGTELGLKDGKIIEQKDTAEKKQAETKKQTAPVLEFKDTTIVALQDSILQFKKDSIAAAYKDSVIAAYKDSVVAAHLDSVKKHNEKISKKLSGKKISIAIIGLDSRIGRGINHADANHVLNIWLDAGRVEVISVPRGTHADAGHGDSTGNDYLANVRSNRGRKKYLRELSRISRVRKIDYYIEFGFSQAIGLIKLLGYKDNAVQVLRTLRSRKAFGAGDHHRAYNQGQFIRQMLLKVFPALDDMSADLLFRSGLYLVETNLDLATCKEIRKKLLEKGFPSGADAAIIRTRPNYKHKYIQYDFTDKASWDELYGRVSNTAVKLGLDEKQNDNSELNDLTIKKLDRILDKARKDTVKNPERVIRALKQTFKQKAWFQISDTTLRIKYRDEICYLLSNAYISKNKMKEAERVQKVLAREIKLFGR